MQETDAIDDPVDPVECCGPGLDRVGIDHVELPPVDAFVVERDRATVMGRVDLGGREFVQQRSRQRLSDPAAGTDDNEPLRDFSHGVFQARLVCEGYTRWRVDRISLGDAGCVPPGSVRLARPARRRSNLFGTKQHTEVPAPDDVLSAEGELAHREFG